MIVGEKNSHKHRTEQPGSRHDHEATESNVRRKVKRVLRAKNFRATFGGDGGGGGGGGITLDFATDRVMEQARVLYRWWPEVPSDGHGL